jgi:cell division protein FtsB
MAGSPAKASHPDGGRLNFWPLALVALILGFAFLGDRGILYMLKLSGQKADLVQKISGVESENHALRSEIGSLRGDRRYIERVARTQLGMVRDDELVFQFSDRK